MTSTVALLPSTVGDLTTALTAGSDAPTSLRAFVASRLAVHPPAVAEHGLRHVIAHGRIGLRVPGACERDDLLLCRCGRGCDGLCAGRRRRRYVGLRACRRRRGRVGLDRRCDWRRSARVAATSARREHDRDGDQQHDETSCAPREHPRMVVRSARCGSQVPLSPRGRAASVRSRRPVRPRAPRGANARCC